MVGLVWRRQAKALRSPTFENKSIEYDVYHDESLVEGYWHGILFVPRDSRKHLLDLLATIRQNTDRSHKLSLKNLTKTSGKLYKCTSCWLQVGIAALIQNFKGIGYVVMFVPIEPALMLAVANDSKLWQQAWNKNILLISPSMFLFVVRTVANLWTQERQNRSVQEIVGRGAQLYDKFVGFVEDLRKVGEQLVKARESYDSAYSKFYTGRGNAIRQAELLKELGVKPAKSLPLDLIEASEVNPALPASPQDTIAPGG